jgi:DNA polymerase-3 subunit beta
MKLSIHRQALSDVLSLATGLVPTRSPKPVLSSVRLSTASLPSGRVLQIVCTDGDMTLETYLPQVDIKQDGALLLPASKFADIVNNSPDETISISSSGEKATITGRDSSYTLLGFGGEGYPPIEAFEGKIDLSIEAGRFKSMLDCTRFAAAKEMTRYAINGVLFEAKGKKLSLVATDGHRMAHVREDINGGDDAQAAESRDISAVVPIKAIGHIEKLLSDPDAVIAMQFRENKIFIQVMAADTDSGRRSVRATFSSTLVEGVFPPYQDVIPKDCDRKASISSAPFSSSVRRASVMTSDDSRAIKVSFTNNQLDLIGRSPELGEARITMPIEYTGPATELGFNPNYLLDAVKVAPTDNFTFEFKASGPALMRFGKAFMYVIMPVTIP